MSEKKRTINWTPDCFAKAEIPAKDAQPAVAENVLYKGHLVLQIPLSEDRCEALLEEGLGEGLNDLDATAQTKAALMVFKKFAKKLMVSAEVERVSDGAKLSLDDVLCEPELLRLPIQLGFKYITGFAPGNA